MRILFESFPRINTLAHDQQTQVEVGTDQWRTTEGILISEHAGHNLLLVGHNAKTKKGLVGQFSEVADVDPKQLRGSGIFEEALLGIQELGEVEQTWVWLGGLALSSGSDKNPHAKDDRTIGLTRIAQRLPDVAGLRHNWIPPERDFMHVQLNAASGTVSIEIANMPGGRGVTVAL